MKDEIHFHPSAFILMPLLPLHLMQRMAAESRAVLFDLDLLHAAGDLDLRAVVQVACLRALQPDHFSILFCHDNFQNQWPVFSGQWPVKTSPHWPLTTGN